MAHDAEDRFPENVVHPEAAARAMTNRNWDEPEAVGTAGVDIDSLDVDLEDETERERSEEHTSELQSRGHLVCRLLLEKKNASTGATEKMFWCTRAQRPRQH